MPKIRTSAARLTLVMWLLAFAFAMTLFFGLLSLPILLVSDVAVGESLGRVFNQSAISLFISLVLLGPLIEEMIFRGWLTGTLRSMAATAIFLGIFYGGTHLVAGLGVDLPAPVSTLIIAGLAGLTFALIERRRQPLAPEFYRILFPCIFWLQGIVFGGLHFANLSGPSLLLPVLATAPLMVCGWLFAYTRIVAGFGSAWLLHALYNLPPALGIILMPLVTGS